MAFSVNTNANAMAALRSLSSTQSNLTNIQSQIQSGLKVGGAADDPSTFVISQGMRGDISALGAVKDGLDFGTASINMALEGATAISTQLTEMQTLVTNSYNEGLDPNVLQAQIDDMVAQVSTIVESANFNGINLLDNGTTTTSLNVLTGLGGKTITQGSVDATTNGLGIDALDLADLQATMSFDNDVVFAAGDTVTTVSGGETHIFEFLAAGTGAAPTSVVNEANGIFVHVVTIDTSASTSEHVGNLAEVMREEGLTVNVADDGLISVADGGAAITLAATTAATDIITILPAGGGSLLAIDAAKLAIGEIMTELGTFSNRLESQAEFTKVLTDTLEEGLGILVDANLAEVSAKLQSEQTKEQLGIQSLSIANAASQSILGLFR